MDRPVEVDEPKRASGRRVSEPAAAVLQRAVWQRPGLTNLGDCCFISSVVQALYSCEIVRRGLVGVLEENDMAADDSSDEFAHLVGRALPGLMRQMEAAGAANVISPQALVRAVRSGTGSAFASGQHDAHELLQQLLLLPEGDLHTLDPVSVLAERTRPARAVKAARVAAAHGPQAIPATGVDSMQQVLRCFQGAVRTAACCLECECSTNEHDETFTTLSISCGHSKRDDAGRSVASGLAEHFRLEHMRGSNKVFCSNNCNTLAEAHRQTHLVDLPAMLCVHLKMLEESSSEAIAVDKELELQPWCSVATNQCTRYHLVAAVFHTGNSPQCGHYLAYCRTNTADRRMPCLRPRLRNVDLKAVAPNGELTTTTWLRCDDEDIEALSDVESHKVLKGDRDSRKGSTPYLCFYAKGPAPTKHHCE
eukprot:COSAG02_NODE_12521_length_1533_cov_1.529986_1_plen_422_part_00